MTPTDVTRCPPTKPCHMSHVYNRSINDDISKSSSTQTSTHDNRLQCDDLSVKSYFTCQQQLTHCSRCCRSHSTRGLAPSHPLFTLRVKPHNSCWLYNVTYRGWNTKLHLIWATCFVKCFNLRGFSGSNLLMDLQMLQFNFQLWHPWNKLTQFLHFNTTWGFCRNTQH